MSDTISINYELNPDVFAKSLAEAEKLEEAEGMIEQLTNITKAKKELKDLLDIVEKYEAAAKGLINSRAKNLYGHDWQAIAGDGFKISRSKTGAIYTRNPDIAVSKKFIEVKESINTKAVDAYFDEKEALPKGIELNPTRGEMIRITIKG